MHFTRDPPSHPREKIKSWPSCPKNIIRGSNHKFLLARLVNKVSLMELGWGHFLLQTSPISQQYQCLFPGSFESLKFLTLWQRFESRASGNKWLLLRFVLLKGEKMSCKSLWSYSVFKSLDLLAYRDKTLTQSGCYTRIS